MNENSRGNEAIPNNSDHINADVIPPNTSTEVIDSSSTDSKNDSFRPKLSKPPQIARNKTDSSLNKIIKNIMNENSEGNEAIPNNSGQTNADIIPSNTCTEDSARSCTDNENDTLFRPKLSKPPQIGRNKTDTLANNHRPRPVLFRLLSDQYIFQSSSSHKNPVQLSPHEIEMEMIANRAFYEIRRVKSNPSFDALNSSEAKGEITRNENENDYVDRADLAIPMEKESSQRVSNLNSSTASKKKLRTELPIFLAPEDFPQDKALRRLSGLIHSPWTTIDISNPSLERRLHDFQFARNRRRQKYGDSKPWGIMGLYYQLAGIRADIEWAEDAAWRRNNEKPYFAWADFDIANESVFNKPFFTYFILIICTVTLLWSFAKNGWTIESMKINPMIGTTSQTLLDMGAKSTPLIVNRNQWYRIITPMVLHAGIIHYFFNMLALWFIGSAVERAHGLKVVSILFIVPAIGGTLLSALFLPRYISVGASGGIFGLIGACVADISMNWHRLFSKDVNQEDLSTTNRNYKVLFLLMADIILNCIIGLFPLVDNFNHLGGMIFGFLVGLSIMKKISSGFFGERKGFVEHLRSVFVRFFGLIICVIAIIVSIVVLSQSDGMTIPCDSCRYFSCVPFPPWKPKSERWWNCDDCGLSTATVVKSLLGTEKTFLLLTCPDKQVEIVDISEEDILDVETVSMRLPSYCLNYCENIFA